MAFIYHTECFLGVLSTKAPSVDVQQPSFDERLCRLSLSIAITSCDAHAFIGQWAAGHALDHNGEFYQINRSEILKSAMQLQLACEKLYF